MDQRISFITLAVRDVAVSRTFYVDGLGWKPVFDDPGDVLMIQVGERLVLSLWAQEQFEQEVGPVRRGPGAAPITLAHNVATREEVGAVLATARAAGAGVAHPPQDREWGGYTGYFTDPDGYHWEIAWNPGPVGQLVL
ncbi:VOC family protein [Myceligenerans indicum]|uniref:Glyoxalase n=1 Tax=Myceligenerans indicum TaxID=2593663 RepID=A0ABS1LHF1_9MICO|nr:VOC family protein [Myceligenerans indicum]MBL0885660.1 glyoxalase [Myceligenerans indicum]